MINQFGKVLNKLDDIIPVLAALDAKFINSIPWIFIIYPVDCKESWNNPTSFIKKIVSKKYEIKFVCAHSLKAKYPPIIFKITQEKVKKAAPKLSVRLHLLSEALSLGAGVKIDVSATTNGILKLGKAIWMACLSTYFLLLTRKQN
jgi:hypothetical protein